MSWFQWDILFQQLLCLVAAKTMPFSGTHNKILVYKECAMFCVASLWIGLPCWKLSDTIECLFKGSLHSVSNYLLKPVVLNSYMEMRLGKEVSLSSFANYLTHRPPSIRDLNGLSGGWYPTTLQSSGFRRSYTGRPLEKDETKLSASAPSSSFGLFAIKRGDMPPRVFSNIVHFEESIGHNITKAKLATRLQIDFASCRRKLTS